MEMIKQMLIEASQFNLGWLSFTAKTVYMVVYLGVTWQLINVATDKIKEGKEKQRNRED